ncbi:iron-containing redox enzyme family protein [Actinophytocola sp.]|uniref:iron-containing redox enzyme family protein n=1 Tax=Actinophytocola sp. TaxID=1872138 RepID=UPI002D7ECCC4|nr:iron-containing redox enzyme family protein [Actinophytocola sp.]HET9140888.1 iron-containing redox enzyme family protein [Actinophytocola sp.]HEU5109248.1 iron-containing redox enzyme family protein [Micromonosporaceae bacterium]
MTAQLLAQSVPLLPQPRGPLSDAVIATLRRDPPPRVALPAVTGADPYGEDLTLALHVCYELHYRGFRSVRADWEWQPDLLALRAELERVFLDAVRDDVPGGADVAATLDPLLVEPVPGDGISHRLRDEGTLEQVREYFVHRSIYHLKEADPHAWVIPRLSGRAKAALVAVEFDEFGGGHADRVHAQLFADLLAAAGLNPGYLHYLDVVPAPAIATVNLMSLFGLHRALRGALVGHFTAAEITTAPSAYRMSLALRRLGLPQACIRFYTEHIEADAVHEQVMRRDVVGDLLDREPDLAADVVLGVQATELLEERLATHLRTAWDAGTTSLRRPLG